MTYRKKRPRHRLDCPYCKHYLMGDRYGQLLTSMVVHITKNHKDKEEGGA